MRNLVYVIEGAGWSTDWDGKSIVANLTNLPAQTGREILGHKNKIIHIGAFPLSLGQDKNNRLLINQIDPSNKVVLTVFHLKKDDRPKVELIKSNLAKIDLLHTSCQLTKKQLLDWRVPENKIRVIPLGVDLDIFQPVSLEEKNALRRKMNIPEDKFIIGSFQKDGQGWGEGNEPKLIKGPDIFCAIVEKLAKNYPIQVCLTGPARGYVKQRLKKAGISYVHRFLDNYEEVVNYFRILDLYLIASRVEGGPKAILESWASGIPLVSTAVGMVPDIALHEKNALLAEPEDIRGLTSQSARLITSKKLRDQLVENGLREVRHYSWPIIAQKYYEQLYQPLIHA